MRTLSQSLDRPQRGKQQSLFRQLGHRGVAHGVNVNGRKPFRQKAC
jgi:hypothetical protein